MNQSIQFFAEQLLERLENEPAIVIAFESQARSAEVGFDFSTAQLAFDRLVEEMDELKQALVDYQNDQDTVEHLCDEATDVIFGTINVVRHAKVGLEPFFERMSQLADLTVEVSSDEQLQLVTNSFAELEKAFEAWAAGDSSIDLLKPATTLASEAVVFVRTCGLSPNEVMRKNVEKYLLRCKFIEDQLQAEQKQWSDISLDEIYSRWEEAKKSGL